MINRRWVVRGREKRGDRESRGWRDKGKESQRGERECEERRGAKCCKG